MDSLKSTTQTSTSESSSSKKETPKEEELHHHQYKDETTQDSQWEKSALPQRNKTLIGNIRQKTFNHMAPYRLEREGRISFFHEKDLTGCKCHYCQIEKEAISKNQKEKNPSSLKVLLQDFSQMTLSPGTEQNCPPSDGLPKNE